MEPIEFKEQTTVYAKNQKEYISLPAHVGDDTNVQITTRWKASLLERLVILLTGKVWISVLTFNTSLAPMKVATTYPFSHQQKENPC